MIGLGGGRYATDWLGVAGNIAAAKDNDIIHRAEKCCIIISKKVFVEALTEFIKSILVISSL